MKEEKSGCSYRRNGVSGLFHALNLPEDKRILMLTKADLESSDSFLAQGGICVMRDETDYDSYFEEYNESRTL